ncbi:MULTISPECIES: apolipoprotein N-acyltransferase [Leeuwenhoekiella]|jgi:apolipoprotein N-acyltransferase|uniref:apolipoprotein N-acyltransferase n=1 Tax=Leeuwenhoekiella TaxID=283735 RepID=UPI000C44ECC5|nr:MULTISPECIES: apolipoprotein N-acyltransferase [Leeuwenhoekiella]MAO44677.1 apolipoprotein N-acyltransferase [Leeuwenhoekiella sp.]|tara:strand:+ start:976 stop:2595 length:1620 start_codon:yes stop_codon:yes gene_type:complete
MKNFLLALATGLLLALAWPTYGFPLLLFFGFVPLLWATHNLNTKAAKRPKLKIFGLAYVAFFTFNIITTWWLYNSTPFGMWFAVLANALLMTFVWMLYVRISKRFATNLSLVFLVALWMGYEFMHLNWEFAWPWLNLGNGFATYTGWIQWYEYTGTFGGTLWVWVLNALLFKALLAFKETKKLKPLGIQMAIAFGIILIPIGISQLILANYTEAENPVEIVLLQPNIDPYTEKYNTTNERIADLLFKEASKTLTPSTEYLIAPETVLAEGAGVDLRNFEFSREKEKATNFLNNYPNLNYLAGIQFYRVYSDKAATLPTSNYVGKDRIGNPVWADFFNSAFLLNASDSTQIYHKSKLVVGVENFPYQSILKPVLGDVMLDLGGTVSMKTTQENRVAFTGTDGTKVGPVICYESVYGDFVTGYVQEGAQFLAIITNDAWWGNTQGHKQHLNYARLRAIETRRSIARSANTGISAFIDQKGAITKELGYGLRGSLKGTINTNDRLTFYVRYGDYLAKLAFIPAIILLVLSFFRKVNYLRASP